MQTPSGIVIETRQNQGPCRPPPSKKRKCIPIVSYGLILFTMISSVPHFLIYQRRDSYEYMDFVRGMWSREPQIRSLLSLMTNEERTRLTSYSFDELWKDLWIDHECRVYMEGYDRAKRKFESILPHLPLLLKETKGDHACNLPWGFSKGKKTDSLKETGQQCALRELKEETRVQIGSDDDIKIWDLEPFIEYYKGTNEKNYSTHYYVAECKVPHIFEKMKTPQCIRKETLSEEASDAKWVGCDEGCLLMNARRGNILRRVSQYIYKKYGEMSPYAITSSVK